MKCTHAARKAQHAADCACSLCKPIRPNVCNTCHAWYSAMADKCPYCPGPKRAVIGYLPHETVHCYIKHNEATGCTCTAPIIVNRGMLEACEGAAFYALSVLKPDARPRTGLTREDLDFLAMSTAKMAAHWGRRALGQENLL